jgi:hypothetical protein
MASGLVTEDVTVGRLVRIRRTVMHMLRDRGYLVVEHELSMTRRDFQRKYGESFHREDMLINKCKKNDPNDQVCSAQLIPISPTFAFRHRPRGSSSLFFLFADGHPRSVSRSTTSLDLSS